MEYGIDSNPCGEPINLNSQHYAKTIVLSFLVSDDSKKHTVSGAKTIFEVLQNVKRIGIKKFLCYKKTVPFICDLNAQLHTTNCPLPGYKVCSNRSFQKKILTGLKMIYNHLIFSHSSGPTKTVEECPAYLKELIVLYKSIKNMTLINILGK